MSFNFFIGIHLKICTYLLKKKILVYTINNPNPYPNKKMFVILSGIEVFHETLTARKIMGIG